MRIYAIRSFVGAAIALVLLSCRHVSAATPDASELFSRTVLPTLQRECLGCHGDRTESGLDLRSIEAVMHGGRRGPAIVPGDPARSVLLQAITGAGNLKMPPGGAKLPAETSEAIAKWIEGGAPWDSAAVQEKWSFLPQDVWAFRPLGKYDLPAVTSKRPVNPIDAFILAKRNERPDPEPRPDKTTLLRRATFDLTGLPPTPEEVDAFLEDTSPDAFAKVVDHLLTSPRYGERWGRHWLDVARYADTDGYAGDKERPNAWRYRDYVIRSFNEDEPFDRFILEQVAGDEIDPNQPENLVAVGFLRMGPWEQTSMSASQL